MPQVLYVPTCGKCGGTQFVGHSTGYGLGAGLVGAALLGPVGLVAGLAGSGKALLVCVGCGARTAPGSLQSTRTVIYAPGEREQLAAIAARKFELAEEARTKALAEEAALDERALALGHTRSDIAVFGAHELLAPILKAERDAQDPARIRAIAAGLDPDATPTVVPIKTTSNRRDRF